MRPYEGIEFYNVGMRNRARTSNTASYRIITGSAADRAIRPSDGRLFHQGHCFGGAPEGDGVVTIGISSGSKVWSNRYGQLPELIDWCRAIARQVASDTEFRTFSGLDHLPLGTAATDFPAPAIAAEWHSRTFLNPPALTLTDAAGGVWKGGIDACDLRVEPSAPGAHSVTVQIVADDVELALVIGPQSGVQLNAGGSGTASVGEQTWPLLEYLNAFPMSIYLADFSSVQGHELLPATGEQSVMLEEMETFDWTAEGVDIEREFGDATEAGTSIHAFLEERLVDSSALIVFYDHGTGEMADLITVSAEEATVTFSFYHCKKSGGADPGARVEDAYEVCGQVVKTSRLLGRPESIFSAIEYRESSRQGSRFAKGDLGALRELVDLASVGLTAFEVVLVQPGISESGMHDPIRDNLASAGDYVRASLGRMRVMASP